MDKKPGVVEEVRPKTGHVTKVDSDFRDISKANDGKLLRLDLACGNAKREGFWGVDVSKDTQADKIMDLEKYPWDFKDNSVFEINVSHYLEHVLNLPRFMEEIYRILIPGGLVSIACPYYSSMRATQDPTHKNMISENTFLYYDADWMKENGLEHYNIKCNFKTMNILYIYGAEWKTRADAARDWARLHYINVVDDIQVVLKSMKKE